MKLRIAGLAAAIIVLLPGVASAQWYEQGRHHHHHHHTDNHHHGYGHRYGFERYPDGYDRPVHSGRGQHHDHRH